MSGINIVLLNLTVPSRGSLELFGTGALSWPSTPETERSRRGMFLF